MGADGLRDLIRDVPDFPSPGIVFKDITPVLRDGASFARVIEELSAHYEGAGVDKVAGIEARGFILATPIAARLGAGFVPIRKPGKLPAAVETEEYELEYGSDALEIHQDALSPRDRVLLIDDVIATGGTAAAAVRLLRRLGAEVVGFSVFVELAFLRGREELDEIDFRALVTYE